MGSHSNHRPGAGVKDHITGVVETALYVADPERSARFYQDVFGFAVVVSSPRLWAMGVAPGQVLLLFRKRASLGHGDLPDHDGDGQLHVAFGVPEAALDPCEEQLARHGVAIESRRTWDGGGRSIYFRDPDGHLLELVTPGVWAGYF